MAHTGGADFGARRYVSLESEPYSVAHQPEDRRVDALLVTGGHHIYASVGLMERGRRYYLALNIPVAVVSASINNSLPGWMVAVGTDMALSTIADATDMLRMSASVSKRVFIAETTGCGCGFLLLVGGLTGGVEKAYPPETGIILVELETGIKALVSAFDLGWNFYLTVVGERINEHYTTDMPGRPYEAERNGWLSTWESTVEHLRQGGTPSPLDHINAIQLAQDAIGCLNRQLRACRFEYAAAHARVEGLFVPLCSVTGDMDWENMRPHTQWWRPLCKPLDILSHHPGQKWPEWVPFVSRGEGRPRD